MGNFSLCNPKLYRMAVAYFSKSLVDGKKKKSIDLFLSTQVLFRLSPEDF
jgi:hypothetical protein